MSDQNDLTLAIEAAIGGGSLALASNGEIVAKWSDGSGPARSEQLVVRIDEVLTQVNATPKNIRHIVVSAGPGSFTGIRIGIATALGLAKAVGANVLRLPLLSAMAAGESGDVTAIVPVGRGTNCFQRFSIDQSKVVAVDEPRPVTQGETIGSLSANSVAIVAAGVDIGEVAARLVEIDNLAVALVFASVDRRVNIDSEPIFISK